MKDLVRQCFKHLCLFFFNLQDGCPLTKTVIPPHSGRQDLNITIYWPESNIGELAILNCPCGSSVEEGLLLQATRYCGGDFISRAKWAEENVAACDFSDLAREICWLKSVCLLILNITHACILFLKFCI